MDILLYLFGTLLIFLGVPTGVLLAHTTKEELHYVLPVLYWLSFTLMILLLLLVGYVLVFWQFVIFLALLILLVLVMWKRRHGLVIDLVAIAAIVFMLTLRTEVFYYSLLFAFIVAVASGVFLYAAQECPSNLRRLSYLVYGTKQNTKVGKGKREPKTGTFSQYLLFACHQHLFLPLVMIGLAVLGLLFGLLIG